MDLLQAAILGIVEGVTEYLPVSSTGHLLLTMKLMNIGQTASTRDAADAYAICIQAGAILAVAGLYFRRLRGIAEGLIGKNPEGLRLGINVLTAFLPAVIAGLTLEKWIKKNLFGGGEMGLWPVVAAWLVGGVVILVIEWRRSKSNSRAVSTKSLAELTWKMALVIGTVQILAMWPGVSRSLATILGGLWAGLSLVAAVEFSFLLGLLTLSAATALDTLKYGGDILSTYGWQAPLVGLITAFVSAAVAVKWLVSYLQKHPLSLFGYYRIAIAIVVAGFLIWH
ncbi:MAG: undecaprenyl-diphosphate phosphatase [bacterium]|jgi:undecaprenyl-diphosphatase